METNPLEHGPPKPPFTIKQQQEPGLESEMNPRLDYGLDSYKGSGKFSGKTAIITGVGSNLCHAPPP